MEQVRGGKAARELAIKADVVRVEDVGGTRTSAVTMFVHSFLTLPSIAVCECALMRTFGVTTRPDALMTVAPAGATTSAPTAVIFPPLMRMVPLSIVPAGRPS